MGITNGIATIPGFVTPSVVGAFTKGKVRNKNILYINGIRRQRPGHWANSRYYVSKI